MNKTLRFTIFCLICGLLSPFLLSGCLSPIVPFGTGGGGGGGGPIKSVEGFELSKLIGGDQGVWLNVAPLSPLAKGYYISCFSFDDLGQNGEGGVQNASPVFSPRSEDDISGGQYKSSIGDFKVEGYVPTIDKGGEVYVASNYFFFYQDIKDKYFDERNNWGVTKGFTFPAADLDRLTSFKDKTIAQLFFIDTSVYKEGDALKRIGINFVPATYIDDFSGLTKEQKLEKIEKELLERNNLYAQSAIFESRWDTAYFQQTQDFEENWKGVFNSGGDSKEYEREMECGRSYDEDWQKQDP